MRVATPQQALQQLAAACARAEICPADALARLRRRGLSAGDAQKVVDELVDRGFIDPERYARAFAADKMRFAGWGRRKIAMALRVKRLAREHISEALDALDPDEYEERLTAILRSKMRSLASAAPEPYELRRKLYAFAAGRGFESDLISRAVRAVVGSASEDAGEGEELWP